MIIPCIKMLLHSTLECFPLFVPWFKKPIDYCNCFFLFPSDSPCFFMVMGPNITNCIKHHTLLVGKLSCHPTSKFHPLMPSLNNFFSNGLIIFLFCYLLFLLVFITISIKFLKNVTVWFLKTSINFKKIKLNIYLLKLNYYFYKLPLCVNYKLGYSKLKLLIFIR